MDPDDSDAAALRARVDALEQTVSEQQAPIDALSNPHVSRRGVLAALTGVAGAGALGAYSQRGAAQAAGQVGTSAEPVDVEAWSLNVQDQLAGDLDAGGNNLTNVGAVEAGSLNTEKVISKSLPVRVSVFESGSDFIAVSENSILSEGDAATVLQSAIDYVFNIWDSTDTTATSQVVHGVVDGNGHTYPLDQSIIHKSGVVLQNMVLDGQNSVTPYKNETPGSYLYQYGIQAANITAKNGDPYGFSINDLSHAKYSNCRAINANTAGWSLSSNVAVTFVQCHADRAAGTFPEAGFELDAGGATDSNNASLFFQCRASGNGGAGYRITSDNARHMFIGCLAESNGTHGWTDSGIGSMYYLPWCEKNDSYGINLAGAGKFHITNAYLWNNQSGDGSPGIQVNNAPNGRIVNAKGNNTVNVAQDSSDVYLDEMRGQYTDGGTRTRINGVSEAALGGTSPTVSNWDVGNVVEDSDNPGTLYKIMPSGSVQI